MGLSKLMPEWVKLNKKTPTEQEGTLAEDIKKRQGEVSLCTDSLVLGYDQRILANLSGKEFQNVNGGFIEFDEGKFNSGFGEDEEGREFELRNIIKGVVSIDKGWIKLEGQDNIDIFDEKEPLNNENKGEILNNHELHIERGCIYDKDDFIPIGDWTGEHYCKRKRNKPRVYWDPDTMDDSIKGKHIGVKNTWELLYEKGSFVVKHPPGINFDDFTEQELKEYEEIRDTENGGNWTRLDNLNFTLSEHGIVLDKNGELNVFELEPRSFDEAVGIHLNEDEQEKVSTIKKITLYTSIIASLGICFQVGAYNDEIIKKVNSIMTMSHIGYNESVQVYYNINEINDLSYIIKDSEIKKKILVNITQEGLLGEKDFYMSLFKGQDGGWYLRLEHKISNKIVDIILNKKDIVKIFEDNIGNEKIID